MKNYSLFCTFLLYCSLASAQLTGIKYIPSTHYPDFKSIIDSLNLHGAGSGGVVFEIAGNQIFNTPLLNLTATGSAGSEITIRWNKTGQKPLLQFSGTANTGEAALTLTGTDFFRMEDITIQSLDNMIEYGLLLSNANVGDACHNNIFKGLTVILDKTNSNQTEGVRVVSLTAPTNMDGTHSGNKFYNNTVQNCTIGYYFDSGTGTVSLMGYNNEVGAIDGGTSLIKDIVLCGVYLKGQNGAKVFGTYITNLERIGGGTTAPAAIATASNNPDTQLSGNFEFFDNVIENHHSGSTSIFGFYLNARKSIHIVYNNHLSNISATGGGTNAASGITVFGTAITAYIYNNFISGIQAPASAVASSPATRGIELRTFSQCFVFYNTVKLEYTATHLAHSSAPLAIINETDLVSFNNNIFINLTELPAQSTGVAPAFFKSTTLLSNMDGSSSNNFYYAGPPSASHPIFYGYNSTQPLIGQTLAEYQTIAGSFDQIAYTGQIQFISGSDLHVSPFDILIRQKGVPISQPFVINTDIDHQNRDILLPDIGADELVELMLLAPQNPWPSNLDILPLEQVDSLSWSYIDDNQHILPNGFNLYINTSNDFGGIEPLWIPYLASQTHYSYHAMEAIGLEYATTYFWKIVPKYTGTGNVETMEIPVWKFNTIYSYPAASQNVFPVDGQSGLTVTTTNLTWIYEQDTTFSIPYGFKIFFGTDSVLIDNSQVGFTAYENGSNTFSYSLATGSLEYNTTYFWKIVPVADSIDGTANPDCNTWRFTTVYPYPAISQFVFPADGQSGLPVTTDSLTWSYEHDILFSIPNGFKVFFGTNPILTDENQIGFIIFQNGSNTFSFQLPTDSLDHLTTYYWKILPVADSANGLSNPDSETWSFTTATYPYPTLSQFVFPVDGQTDLTVTTDSIVWMYEHNNLFSIPYGYKVFFGIDSALLNENQVGFVLFENGINTFSYQLETDSLLYETTYFWKILPVADSANGMANPGCNTWSFTTEVNSIIASVSYTKPRLYPNPAHDFIRVFSNEKMHALIFSADGRIITSKIIDNPNETISLKGLAPGIYDIRLMNNKHIFNLKFVLE